MDSLHTWDREIRVRLWGAVLPGDVDVVDSVVRDINRIAGRRIMSRVGGTSNLDVLIGGQDIFDEHAYPEFRRARGFFHVHWQNNAHIDRGRVLVRAEVKGAVRSHIIREEITQALGLFDDSWKYRNSIFYQGPSAVTSYSPLDETIIWLHMQHATWAGVSKSTMRKQLRKRFGIPADSLPN